jgi:hypothetical protein
MSADNELASLLSSISRSHAPVVGENADRQDGMGPYAAQAQQEATGASHHGQAKFEARLARIETRQAYAECSLAYLESCRSYVGLRLEDTVDEDMAYTGDVVLLARVDAALESIGTRLAGVITHLVGIGAATAYTGAEIGLSNVEASLADIEDGLVGIGASIAHADALLPNVGAGTGTPNPIRAIPLPGGVSGYGSVSVFESSGTPYSLHLNQETTLLQRKRMKETER